MLIFQKNIYEKTDIAVNPSGDAVHFIPEYHLSFDARHFIEAALQDEESLIETLRKQPGNFLHEETCRFFPNAYKIGGLEVIGALLRILQQGLVCESGWYHMNTYHFCVLYDVLYRYAYNYNRDSLAERRKALPSLKGASLPFDLFVKDYFFNTVFLLDKDVYNSLTAEEKRQRGFTCPCQFAVINGLAPTREEMELQKSRDYPYTLYV
ncbi:MAG: hypothetical protein ACE5G9_06315 [Nitrospinales bacterium]